MPTLNFVKTGSGPLVVLSHALGCDLSMWDGVVDALRDRYTVLCYDHRGHGRSPAYAEAFTINELADDAAELIRLHGAGVPAHFVGLSMGGMTAQSLGARQPNLVRSLVIANSACNYDEVAKVAWQSRIETVQAFGVASIAEVALQRWFSPEFRSDTSNGGSLRVAQLRAVLEGCKPAPYAAACAAVASIQLDKGNAQITCPTLVISGDRDEATPPAMSQRIAESIPNALLCSLDAAHLSAVEQPREFAACIAKFWTDIDR